MSIRHSLIVEINVELKWHFLEHPDHVDNAPLFHAVAKNQPRFACGGTDLAVVSKIVLGQHNRVENIVCVHKKEAEEILFGERINAEWYASAVAFAVHSRIPVEHIRFIMWHD